MRRLVGPERRRLGGHGRQRQRQHAGGGHARNLAAPGAPAQYPARGAIAGVGMRGLFIDADQDLARVFDTVVRPSDPPVTVNRQAHVAPPELPALLAGYDFILNDHTYLPTDMMRQCPGVRHVIFLGTGARSYMSPEELADLGITVHIIKGYGDIAVAEHAIALMWAAARNLAAMDRGIRAGHWPRSEGVQLTGKTIGLLGFGGIAAEVARLAGGFMRVLAWNRTPRTSPGVSFVDLDTLLAESHVLSLHLLLNDETRGFLDAARLARLRPGAILVNTARGALVDEDAMVAALADGALGHAALDVFAHEPLPPGHRLATLERVTLSAHSAFRTPEASETLIRRALDIAIRVTAL
jgi:D-3-phosphoglycerate dehydrogenase / 2-oxoglutarate reductase